MVEALPQQIRDHVVTLTPAGRLNTPEDVAATVVFLGSVANTAITGEAIKASGGR
jgi:NAD(P)-dependent dehydrogenase (short-subunit alcohol dehydrogenase family)